MLTVRVFKVMGEKEWMNTKHGTKQRKVWRKLHLMIDDSGEILNSALTTHEESDVSQASNLLENIDDPIDELIGDSGGCDHAEAYEALAEHEHKMEQKAPIQAVIPPNIGFKAAHVRIPINSIINSNFIRA